MIGQSPTAILVFCLITLPFWAVMVVGMISADLQRLPFAARTESLPVGNLTSKLDTGTSGIEA